MPAPQGGAISAWQRARSGQLQHKALMGFRTLRDMHDSAPVVFDKMEFVKSLGGANVALHGRLLEIRTGTACGRLRVRELVYALANMHTSATPLASSRCL